MTYLTTQVQTSQFIFSLSSLCMSSSQPISFLVLSMTLHIFINDHLKSKVLGHMTAQPYVDILLLSCDNMGNY